MGLKQQIRQEKGTIEPFPAPEWPTVKGLHLRIMSEAEAQTMFAENEADQKKPAAERRTNARIAVRVLCDEDGQRIYQDIDIEELAAKGIDILRRIAARALEMHGFTEEAAEALEGNSEATPGGDSSSS